MAERIGDRPGSRFELHHETHAHTLFPPRVAADPNSPALLTLTGSRRPLLRGRFPHVESAVMSSSSSRRPVVPQLPFGVELPTRTTASQSEIFAVVRDFRELNPENRALAQALMRRMIASQLRLPGAARETS